MCPEDAVFLQHSIESVVSIERLQSLSFSIYSAVFFAVFFSSLPIL
jgi:hypothetical protein